MSAVQQLPLETTVTKKDSPRTRVLIGLTILTALAVAFGLYMALVYAGTDQDQGDVQRIFYIHVPAFFGAFTAFTATLIGGIQYLRTRDNKWDTLALAGVEVGLALSLVNLITGSIWARPIWNTWWTWDPRLTSAAVMVLTYAAYLMLRSGIENPDTRRRFASVYGILAMITVIATLIIIRIRPDTIHPSVIGPSAQNAQGTFELQATAGVGAAIGVNMLIWLTLVPITLMWWRIRLQNLADTVEKMKMVYLER